VTLHYLVLDIERGNYTVWFWILEGETTLSNFGYWKVKLHCLVLDIERGNYTVWFWILKGETTLSSFGY
jgi:hypothetical protein